MNQSRAGIIRGLSIAVVILSAISILGSVLGVASFVLGGVAASSSEFATSIELSGALDAETLHEMQTYGITTSDLAGATAAILLVSSVFFVWAIICSVISLIAGILGIRNCRNTDKLGATFGWAIAGAVASFLYGNVINTVLLVISAVCISRDRKDATAVPYGQPAAYTQMPGQAGYYAATQQPGQPYGQPGQAYSQPGQAYTPQAAQPYAQQAAQSYAPQGYMPPAQQQPAQPQQPTDQGGQQQ